MMKESLYKFSLRLAVFFSIMMKQCRYIDEKIFWKQSFL
jgi:hypothetical protein